LGREKVLNQKNADAGGRAGAAVRVWKGVLGYTEKMGGEGRLPFPEAYHKGEINPERGAPDLMGAEFTRGRFNSSNRQGKANYTKEITIITQ